MGTALVGFALGRRGGPLLQQLVEATAILAGATPSLSWTRVGLAATVESLPAAVVYAVAGAAPTAAGTVVPLLVLVVAFGSLTWLVEYARTRGATDGLRSGGRCSVEPERRSG
ncbi:MAG: hypothetical protein M3P83_12670 [Actinomycetota bacterium]|nr:hypothetical protein [Actinomycetota bacterium]